MTKEEGEDKKDKTESAAPPDIGNEASKEAATAGAQASTPQDQGQTNQQGHGLSTDGKIPAGLSKATSQPASKNGGAGQGGSQNGAAGVASGQAGDRAEGAIEMLRADHRRAEAMFVEYEQADDDSKSDIIEDVCHALIIHTLLEEQVFYPACRREIDGEPLLDEAQVERDAAKVLINDLLRRGSRDPYRDGNNQRDERGRYTSRGGRDYDDDGGQGGWFGDSEGHADAARRGW